MPIVEVVKYRCSDGTEYLFRETAEIHENELEAIRTANDMLVKKAPLHEILTYLKSDYADDPIFSDITKDTEIRSMEDAYLWMILSINPKIIFRLVIKDSKGRHYYMPMDIFELKELLS